MDYKIRKLLDSAKDNIKKGLIDRAQDCIFQVLSDIGDDADAYLEVGQIYVAFGNYPLASVYVRKSFDLKKSYETLEFLANVNYLAHKFDLAAVEYEELIKRFPKKEFYEHCMKSYEKLDFYEESIRIAKMYNSAYGDIDSYSELLIRYIVAGMEEEARTTGEKMKELFSNNSKMFNMIGLLEECINNDYEKAKEYFKKSARSGSKSAFYNLGVCCKQSEDLVNAEKYLSKLKSESEAVDKNYNYTLGTVYFSERKLRLGYKHYKKRRSAQKNRDIYSRCLWDGKEYPDLTLFVASEQGFGDNIMISRYLPFVAKKFKTVYYAVPPVLLNLLKPNYETEENPNLKIISDEERVKFDKFAMVMDLPYLLHQSFHNIPSKEFYLQANERKTDMFKKNFFENDNLKIGLNWRAKGMGLRDAVYRTIDAPYYFRNIMNLEGIKYYSFQFGDIFDMCKKYPQIEDLSKHLKDFSDSAAALKNIDILITVDTALAHLAGAMGVKTYLLLCHAPDWRWFDNDKKTEWYPSVTIIKQQDRRTWEDVSEKLTEYINRDLNEYRKNSS
ncbi:MAG: hypothetical protein K6E29_04795 [Cyanobacteria bacterium RUI128]|nr:hypothetical protein [Cyanobacteria bacterium RUI128]